MTEGGIIDQEVKALRKARVETEERLQLLRAILSIDGPIVTQMSLVHPSIKEKGIGDQEALQIKLEEIYDAQMSTMLSRMVAPELCLHVIDLVREVTKRAWGWDMVSRTAESRVMLRGAWPYMAGGYDNLVEQAAQDFVNDGLTDMGDVTGFGDKHVVIARLLWGMKYDHSWSRVMRGESVQGLSIGTIANTYGENMTRLDVMSAVEVLLDEKRREREYKEWCGDDEDDEDDEEDDENDNSDEE